jgi:hypothetical protein
MVEEKEERAYFLSPAESQMARMSSIRNAAKLIRELKISTAMVVTSHAHVVLVLYMMFRRRLEP